MITDKVVGIAAILIASAGFLLKGVKLQIRVLKIKCLWRKAGEQLTKENFNLSLAMKILGMAGIAKEFSNPIREETVKKLSRRGLIPNFVASPGYPSYKEWLMKNLEKNTRTWETPQLHQYKNGYQIPLYDRNARLPTQYDSKGNRIPYPKAQEFVGNIYNPKARFTYESWKYPTPQLEVCRQTKSAISD